MKTGKFFTKIQAEIKREKIKRVGEMKIKNW